MNMIRTTDHDGSSPRRPLCQPSTLHQCPRMTPIVAHCSSPTTSSDSRIHLTNRTQGNELKLSWTSDGMKRRPETAQQKHGPASIRVENWTQAL
jgi:hypothetical protein